MTKRRNFQLPRRSIILSLEDERRFSELVIAKFPHARFFDEIPNSEKWGIEKPEVILRRSLSDCQEYSVVLIFEKGWVPEVKLSASNPHFVEYDVSNIVFPIARINRSSKYFQRMKNQHHDDKALSVEVISDGHISFACLKSEPEHIKLARSVLRLIGKVATNKYRGVDWPTDKERYRFEKGGHTWIGHDAARWALQALNRRLSYSYYADWGVGVGLLPLIAEDEK